MKTPSGRRFVPLKATWLEAETRSQAAQARLEELEAERTREHEASSSDLREARRRLDDARHEIEMLRSTVVRQLEERIDGLERRLEASEASRVAAEHALDATLTSSSWRLTLPLRAAMDVLRGRRQAKPEEPGDD
ncbi:MAG: hypothetical protein AAFY88_07310 [Acidobacteriota bacterium]